MKKLLSAIIAVIMVLSALPYVASASGETSVSDILSQYEMTETVRSDDFTTQTALDTQFWKITGKTSGIGDGKLKIAKNGGTLSQVSPVYREDYAVDIKFTFPQFTTGSPDYNGPHFQLTDSNGKKYYGLMQWGNYSYYQSESLKTPVATDLFRNTYAANVKIDDGDGNKKERIYLQSIDYRILIVVSGGITHTYLLDTTTGNEILKFDDYEMNDANINSATTFAFYNALSYDMTIDSISIYTKPDTSFAMTMATPEYISSDDSIVFDLDKEVEITSANGLTVTDSDGNAADNIAVSSDGMKLNVDFDKQPHEKYEINIDKDSFGNGEYTPKNNYKFTVYTYDNPRIYEDFSDTALSTGISVPINSTVADGVLKMGQYTQNMLKINAVNTVTEFDLTVTDPATNPELWYLFRIVEKTDSNNTVSPDAAQSEVLKLKFTNNGLAVTLSDKNTAVKSETIAKINKNNKYTLRLVNIEKEVEIQVKENGIWKKVFSGELTSEPYSSYMSFNWRGTAFEAVIDNLKCYDFGDTYKLVSNAIPKLSAAKVSIVTASEADGIDGSAIVIKDNDGADVAFTFGTSKGNVHTLILTQAPEDGKTYTVTVGETVKSLYGTPFRPEKTNANVFNASDESANAFCDISVSETGTIINVDAGIKNFGDLITDGVIIAAIYDTTAENGITTLLDTEIVYITAENPIAANSEKALNFSLDAGNGYTGTVGVKLFAWNNFDDLLPVIYPVQTTAVIQ